VVERRRLSRLRTKAQQGDIVIELKDSSTEVFPMGASLEFTVACWAEGMAADRGEEYTWDPEMERLKKALENATPESRDEFYAEYTPVVAWEEECRRRNAHAEE
jgi:hypothetical protein